MKKLILLTSLFLGFFSAKCQVITLIDSKTNENVNFKKIPLLPSGSVIDGVVYASKNGNYYKRIITTFINPSWFGAIPDDGINDSDAIQKALNFAFREKLNVLFITGLYNIDKTIVIPTNFSYSMDSRIVDFSNSEFKIKSDITVLQSSNWNSESDSNFSTGIILKNLKISSDKAINDTYALQLQDYHQGTLIENMSSFNHKNFLYSRNNFYAHFISLRTNINSQEHLGVRFLFEGAHNLNKIENCVAVNSSIGYQFTTGGITALNFTGNSVEGTTVGLQFDTAVYSANITNCYVENFKTFLKTTSYVFNIQINNNYFNALNDSNSYLLDYLPLPINNILFDFGNHYERQNYNNFIKTKENNYGRGIIFNFFTIFDPLDKSKIESSKGANILTTYKY